MRNLIGSSSKGHEYFLKHLLGTKNAVLEDDDAPTRPEEIKWREADGAGKLDLLIDIDFRMASIQVYILDIVFPAATWYEKEDLSSTRHASICTCIPSWLLIAHGKLN